jgi:hypothetical protein
MSRILLISQRSSAEESVLRSVGAIALTPASGSVPDLAEVRHIMRLPVITKME